MSVDGERLKQKIIATYPEQQEIILKAYDFAEKAHTGQKRSSGEDYFTHPCAVVEILMDFNFDASTLVAGFLHDVVEDTPFTLDDIKREFGQEIADLVEGVTKLDKLLFINREEAQAENLKKMFLAMAKDLRVIIIKFADRLHNMRSLDYLPPEKQQYISRETLDFFAPLAGRLGISFFKCELEDIAMRYLYPVEYEHIAQYFRSTNDERLRLVEEVKLEIENKLKEIGIRGEVNGRAKHYYSIYKKMKSLGVEIEQIYDLTAMRVIVDTVKDCYAVLGEIHNMWKPIPGRFKDYISLPKANNYQSLHTTVITQFNQTFEIQIRTVEMHKIADYGVAAHWKYKEGRTTTSSTELDSKVTWIREMLDEQKELGGAREFIDAMKINVFDDEVFVFTPKGAVHSLPIGSTPLDLAYKIHSEIGNHCVGAKINKKIVPLSTKLNTGDIVEILTNNASKGPSRDWLNIAHTANARSKIKQFFKREMKEENIRRGRDMLTLEAKHRGYSFKDLIARVPLDSLLQRQSAASLDDLYAAVGFGALTTGQVLIKLIDQYKKLVITDVIESKDTLNGPAKIGIEPRRRASAGVLIEGNSDFSVRLSRCCNPVPGDAIIGYVSRGRGVSVHRQDCSNVAGMEKERLIVATWDRLVGQNYTASLAIVVENRSGILAAITTLLANLKLPITAVNANLDSRDNIANIDLSFEISSTEELEEAIRKIQALQGVISIRRI